MTDELYLSRLILNPLNSSVQKDVRDCHKMHCRVMSGFPKLEVRKEPEEKKARERFGVLYRVDWQPKRKRLTLLVQSNIAPSWDALPGDYLRLDTEELNPTWQQINEKLAALRTGDRLNFRLRANPTSRIGKTKVNNKLCGKRVEIYDEAKRLAWLERKARDGGFTLLTIETGDRLVPRVQVSPEPKRIGWRPKGNGRSDGQADITERTAGEAAVDENMLSRREGDPDLRFGSVVFEGILQVTDVEQFLRTLRAGIGTGKAYGFGLLSIAPARREE